MAEKVNGKLGLWSLILGVVAVVIALLPFLSTWFLLLSWLLWVLAPVAILLGIFGIVKNQKKSIAGVVAAVVAIAAYFFVLNSDYIAQQAAEDAAKAGAAVVGAAYDAADDYDYEW